MAVQFSSLPYWLASRLNARLPVAGPPAGDERSAPGLPAPAILRRARAWIENSQTRRRMLNCQMLDPRFAGDIGLTSAEIVVECRKPFWAGFGLSREENPVGPPAMKMHGRDDVVRSQHSRAA
ncbi:MAG TPA: hypothetical protein VK430_09125 [Xanthobacteraceae bacterium]|nr:hypothetical protein [Xanthobacteraceae bacterium]